ncbi:MAG: phosphoribosylglycinamide formyltransferase [Actinomycetota bacterium]|nr:phosphoribosylglycinamide formyltransferase [Actinomycetota bacterium]
MVARLVVLASGSGTLLQALMDASVQGHLPAQIVAVGSDVPGCLALERAAASGIETFACAPRDFVDRRAWDLAMRDALLAFRPSLVVSAGFMRILGADVVDAFAGYIINTHPALLPSFPGAHAVRDALAHGVKVTGCTVHVVDRGVDTGPILAQRAVEVRPGDDEASLHERIKHEERLLLVETVNSLIGEQS